MKLCFNEVDDEDNDDHNKKNNAAGDNDVNNEY